MGQLICHVARFIYEVNFLELRQGEVRRTSLLGGWVNKGKKRARMRCPGPMMASALRRLVGEIENARAEGLRVDELQRLLIAPVLKQMLSVPHNYGMEHEPKLVEEVLFKQRPDQGRAAGYRDVLTWLLRELGDLFRDISLDKRRVVPC